MNALPARILAHIQDENKEMSLPEEGIEHTGGIQRATPGNGRRRTIISVLRTWWRYRVSWMVKEHTGGLDSGARSDPFPLAGR